MNQEAICTDCGINEIFPSQQSYLDSDWDKATGQCPKCLRVSKPDPLNEPPPPMDREALLHMAEVTFHNCLSIMRMKNADYSGGGGPFENFMTSKHVLGIPAELGILMRCMDKFQRIRSFVVNGELQVKDESVQDAISDVINYMVLLKGVIQDKQNAQV